MGQLRNKHQLIMQIVIQRMGLTVPVAPKPSNPITSNKKLWPPISLGVRCATSNLTH